MPGRPTAYAYGRSGGLLCLLQVRDGWAVSFFFFFFFFFLSFFFISSTLTSFSKASPLGRRLDILKYFGLGRYNPTVVVSYYQRRTRLVLVNRLVGISLPRNSANG